MFESYILPSLITKLNFWTKNLINCYIYNKFLAICDYIRGLLINTIQCFKMWRRFFIRIKLILKFQKDCNFAGRFHIHLFFLLIFLLSFLVNLRIVLYQKGLILIHISYNRIDRIIMAKIATWKTETTFCLGMPILV